MDARTDNRQPHGRVALTRGWVVESSNQLMLQRGYDRFGVTELVRLAGTCNQPK